MAINCDLDHVAVACERQADAWPRYAGDLAGDWIGGGATAGFASAQVRYANGMKLEVLEPHQPEANDFLRRFLDRRGPGPHHLTFKTPDLARALEQSEAAGYRPVGVDLSDPMWKEAFLHPKDAPGVVVQLAEAAGDDDWWSPPPADLPRPRTATPSTLVHVVHAVADLDDGRRLFEGLLGGEATDEGDDGETTWVELRWPGPGVIRLAAPRRSGSDLAEWIAGERGRLHHVAFATDDPAAVPGARPSPRGGYEIDPESNHGLRLHLHARG